MMDRFFKTWRKTMEVLAILVALQVSMYFYFMVKYRAWEMWPGLVLIALCGGYFLARSKGWMEPSE